MIDTHCHLNFHAFNEDLPQVINRAKKRGITKIIIPGTDLASSRRAIKISETYSNCWAAVGIHPHHAKDENLMVNSDLRHELKQLLTHKRVVAAGEIGMDYFIYKNTKYPNTAITNEYKKKQHELFVMQMELAKEYGLPMILHCRDAHDDMIQTISKFTDQTISNEAKSVKNNSRNRETSTLLPGVFHCFGGSTQHLELLISMGFYIGFDGNITYGSDHQKLVQATPLERILLETDAPFLTPVPHRGTRNEPMYLPIIATAISEYKNIQVSEVIHNTSQNAISLFGFVSG